MAIKINLTYSFDDHRPDPTVILEMVEVFLLGLNISTRVGSAALLICSQGTRMKSSCHGNSRKIYFRV